MSVSFGQYSNATLSDDGGTELSGTFDHKTIHEWIAIGAKGTFGL